MYLGKLKSDWSAPPFRARPPASKCEPAIEACGESRDTLTRMLKPCRIVLALSLAVPAVAQQIDWQKVNDEAMRNYQSLMQIDSTTTEAAVAAFVKKTLESEGIAVSIVAKDPAHPNVIARIKGNGSKK